MTVAACSRSPDAPSLSIAAASVEPATACAASRATSARSKLAGLDRAAMPTMAAGAAALDDDLHQVSRQDEAERGEHREIDGDERVEDELGGELGREANAVGGDDHRHEHGDEHGDADQNERGVVAEPANHHYSFGF